MKGRIPVDVRRLGGLRVRREDRLHQSQNAAKCQGKMPDFPNHPPLLGAVFHSAGGGAAPCAGFQWPARFNASATSGGI